MHGPHDIKGGEARYLGGGGVSIATPAVLVEITRNFCGTTKTIAKYNVQ